MVKEQDHTEKQAVCVPDIVIWLVWISRILWESLTCVKDCLLTMQYWVDDESEKIGFSDINLFENALDEVLSYVAYTGRTKHSKTSDRPVYGVDNKRPVSKSLEKNRW